MTTKSFWLAALCLALILPVHAQNPQNAPETRPRLSVQLKAVPLRDAIQMVFNGSGQQYAIDPNVPNLPITLDLRDVTVDQALRIMVRQATPSIPGLTVRRDGEVYLIKIQDALLANQELTFEKVPVQFQRVEHILRQLQHSGAPRNHAGDPGQGTDLTPEGVSAIHISSTDNSLLVRGTLEGIQALKHLVRFIDLPERTLALTVGVTGPGLGGRQLHIQSSARTLNGRNVTIDEEVPAGAQRSKLKIRLEPFVRGDGAIHVDADWDVAVSVPGGRGEAIRLVKRFQSSTALQPGIGVAVSTVNLATWGGAGEVRFWLKGQMINGYNRTLVGPAGEKLESMVHMLGEVPYLPVGALAPNWTAELVRHPQGYELVWREKPLPEGIIANASRPKTARIFDLFIHGNLVSERLLFAASEGNGGDLVADPEGEPYLPLADVARRLGGKLEFDPLTDTYRIVGGKALTALLAPETRK